jgi:hypothetical protein
MPFPPAPAHGELREIFDGVYFVSGAARIGPPMPMTLSRNMTVVRSGESLALINSMRLDEDGLKALDALGKVEHVIRIGAFHGMDDPFYEDRYGATVWALDGSAYTRGFEVSDNPADGYFQADEWLTGHSELPIEGATLYRFDSSRPAEGLVLLERDGGILIAGDSLQNMAKPDAYCNLTAKVVMRLMGFFKPHNVGPGWWKIAKPDHAELQAVLDLPFEHLLPVHGTEVVGGAKEKFRPAIERLAP